MYAYEKLNAKVYIDINPLTRIRQTTSLHFVKTHGLYKSRSSWRSASATYKIMLTTVLLTVKFWFSWTGPNH